MTKARKIATAVIGSFVEWYDFALIGALSKYINNNFFDESEPLIRLVNIFLIFAVGYLARPLGALFFGYYGDQHGRQAALRLSLVFVSLATFLIGFLPSAHQTGILATASLITLRFFQGFGSGGEHAGGILLLYEDEQSFKSTKANYAITAIMCGLFFGFISAYMLQLFFEDSVIIAWAWRIPFIFGGILGIFGVILRMRHATETPVMNTSTWLDHYRKFFTENKKQVLIAMGMYIHSVAIFYANYFFYPAYIEEHHLVTSAIINEVRVTMAIAFIAMFLFFNKYLNDGNHYLWLKVSLASTLFLIFPLHYAMLNHGLYGYCVATVVMTLLNVIYLLPIAGLFSGLFARKYRYTGLSFVINMVSSLFGGTTPLILIFWVNYFNFVASGTYLFITAAIGYVTINWLWKDSNEEVIYAR